MRRVDMVTVAALPTAEAARYGAVYRLRIDATDDTYWFVRRLAAGTYDWAQLEAVAGGAGGTEYVEDDATVANPHGPTLLLRRRDALSGAEVSADLDWVAANATAKGELYVKQTDAVPVTDNAGSLTVDNAGTFAVQDSQVVADNAAFTDGTTKLFMTGYVLDDTAGTALTENDAAAPRISANRATVGVIEDGATRARYATVTAANALKVDASGAAVPVTDNSGSLTVDNAGTFAVQDSQAIADNAAFTDGTSKVLMAGFAFDEAAGTALTENDAAAGRVDSKRAQVFVVEDETTRGTRLTVKAASTAPVAADKAAVVAVSPNSLVAVPASGTGVASLPVKATATSAVLFVAAGGTQTSGALTANTEVILWNIEHAAGSTKTVRIHRITADFVVTTAPAAAGIGEVRVYRGTAVGTGGSTLTGQPTRPGAATVDATVRTNKPTITAATTLFRRIGWMAAAQGNWSYGNGDNVVYAWDPQLDHEPLTLRASNADTVAVVIIHSSTPTLSYNITAWFTEE